MNIYETYQGNPSNKDYEYQKRGKVWYKRRIGSKDSWSSVESQYNDYLDRTFKVKMFNNIKPLYRFGIPLAGIVVAYYVYKKVLKG
jgi:hypothetical protein